MVSLLTAVPAARAHAPLARELAVAPSGDALAVRMPGFGLLVRTGGEQPFAYACDGLLGIAPDETVNPMAYRSDGGLLIGAARGLRMLDANGCPLPADANDLGDIAVLALAAAANEPQRMYAATGGATPAVQRSDDGGAHWELAASLASDVKVTALVVPADRADAVYLSADSTDMRSAILISEDGGTSFTRIEQERALRLLLVEPGSAARLWAVARALDSKGGRGFELLRAGQPEGPWQALLRVNFFGGFARDEDGVLWAGDEGGGLFRSADGGDHFDEVQPDQAVACLATGHDALWACTPGTSRKRAVATSTGDGTSPLADVIAFAGVDRMVDCPGAGVTTQCAAAWTEWQVDVRMLGAPAPDASAPAMAPTADAGTAVPTDGLDPSVDAGAPATATADPPERAGTCALRTSRAHDDDPMPTWFACGLAGWLAVRRVRRSQS